MACMYVRPPGMTAEQASHAFDPYWQADGTRRDGAGLGLSIVKRLVEAHDGEVAAMTREGHGSTFSFVLPVARD